MSRHFRPRRQPSGSDHDPRRGERGAVLIIAVALLAIMAILGLSLLAGSTSEVQLSGNYRNQQEAFLAADRAVEYSINQLTTGSGTIDLNTGVDADGTPHRDQIAAAANSGLDTSVPNSVEFIGEGPPPDGAGTDVNIFKARNYIISVAAVSPANAANPARTVVRAQVAKIVAK